MNMLCMRMVMKVRCFDTVQNSLKVLFLNKKNVLFATLS